MKRFIFLLMLSFHKTWASELYSEYEEDQECWVSIKNKDGTYNVTFDCSLSNNKTLELKLWSSKFPKSLKSLKIQNCERLVLDSNCTSDEEPIRTFNYLHVLNISQFSLIGRVKETSDNPYSDTSSSIDDDLIQISSRPKALSLRAYESSETSTTQSEIISAVRLPSNAIFENIKMAEFDTPLISTWLMPCGLRPGEYKFESLKLINVTMPQLNSSFLWEDEEDSEHMKELIMKNLNIERPRSGAIYLHNDKASVEITNSLFNTIKGTLADLDVSKVVISQNVFEELQTHAFVASADRFTFSKNEVGIFSKFALKLECTVTEIIDNVIDHIQEYALIGIDAPQISPNLRGIPPQRTLNISNNIIHAIAPAAFRLDFIEPRDEKSFFDIMAITNNRITCSCMNIFWFTNIRIVTSSVPQRLIYYLWFNKDNHNACWNIPNCGLSQVLYNMEELCEVDYKCPNVSLSWAKPLQGDFSTPTESNLELSDVLINLNVTGILEDLTNLLKENIKNSSVRSYDVEFRPYLKILSWRQRRGNLYDDTELNSSEVSLTA